MKLQDFLAKNGCEDGLAQLMGNIIPAAVRRIRKAMEVQTGEMAGSKNVYGEVQLALDLQANEIVLDELKKSGLVSWAASEEMKEEQQFQLSPTDPSSLIPDPSFSVVFDPLDGSSLVDVNFAVGSIFGVYPAGDPVGRIGQDQLAACYAVYGPHTTLVMTVKKGTHEFRLAADGEFYLSRENLRVEPDARHFAPGNLRAAAEREDYLELTNAWIRKGLTLRYSGGMVPDINHILLKGDGIFTYPGYSKAPEGKLRLLFECAPMALLMEQAEGSASDGQQKILSKKITELHKRSPIFIGSSNAAEQAVQSLNR